MPGWRARARELVPARGRVDPTYPLVRHAVSSRTEAVPSGKHPAEEVSGLSDVEELCRRASEGGCGDRDGQVQVQSRDREDGVKSKLLEEARTGGSRPKSAA